MRRVEAAPALGGVASGAAAGERPGEREEWEIFAVSEAESLWWEVGAGCANRVGVAEGGGAAQGCRCAGATPRAAALACGEAGDVES